MAARRYFPVQVLVAAAAFFAFDIVTDLRAADESPLHVAIEALVFLLTASALLLEIRRVLRLRAALAEDRARLARLSGELFAVMQRAFERWGLSPSESEVALLLDGLPHLHEGGRQGYRVLVESTGDRERLLEQDARLVVLAGSLEPLPQVPEAMRAVARSPRS